MRLLAIFGFALLAAMAAEKYTGTLVDADCKGNDTTQECPVGELTTRFGLVQSDGKFYPFDAHGDALVRAAERTQKITLTGRTVIATGTVLQPDSILKVESVQIK